MSEIQVMTPGSNPLPLHYCCSVVIVFVWRKKILGKGVKGPWVLASCDFFGFCFIKTYIMWYHNFYLDTLTLQFDLFLKSFNIGCY